ncbi:MAG: hypothetical protein R6V48_04615 [Fidelibacterota bacterium]
MIAFPPFIIGGIMISRYDPLLLIPWIMIILFYFGFVEIRVLCSHCPHYAEPDTGILKCWANYGSPKCWKYRPGPLSLTEKTIFYLGFIVIFIYPVIFFILENSYILLGIYIVLIIILKLLLKRHYCSRCINFACPFNNVGKEVRNRFFSKNPIIETAWKDSYKLFSVKKGRANHEI